MSDQAEGNGERRKRGRSPSYPAVDLKTAIDRAREIWQEDHQYLTALPTIFKHWGLKSAAGVGPVIIAALRKFGLVEYEGTGAARRARLTDLAVEILDHPDQTTQRAAIKRAALTPVIHADLWGEYGDQLPSDAQLRWTLVRDRGFTETGADEFIPEYKATLAFAGLTENDKMSPQTGRQEGEDEEDDEGKSPPPPPPPGKPQQRRRQMSDSVTYAVPVASGSDVTVEGRFPLSEPEWVQFMAVLTAMKPALVVAGPPPREESQDED